MPLPDIPVCMRQKALDSRRWMNYTYVCIRCSGWKETATAFGEGKAKRQLG
jgi:hypothetical protein